MIAVVGEALVDLVIASDGSVRAHLGGAPYNAARAASRLGAAVSFLGTLSTDRFGGALAQQLEADGVDTSRAGRVDLPTTLAAAEIDTDGAATYRFYTEGTSAPVFDSSVAVVAGSAYVLTGGLALVLQPIADHVESLVAEVARDVVLMVDLNCRPAVVEDRDDYVARVERVVQRADVVKASTDDLRYLRPDAEPADAARSLVDSGAQVVLVTDGAAPVEIHTREGVVAVPVPEVDVVDTIGAGDTFTGGFLASCALRGVAFDTGRPTLDVLAEIVADATAASAVSCERAGADPPYRLEVARWRRLPPVARADLT